MVEAILISFTIWRLTSPSSGEVVVVAKQTEPFEPEHEYQQVLRRVNAYSAKRALQIGGNDER